MQRHFIAHTEEESQAAGQEIAHLLPRNAAVHLIGDLGAGKTFLVRAIAAELGAEPLEVSSPSFAIVHEYPVQGGDPIIHIDAYRLTDRRREWLEIGIPDLLAGPGLKLIEWPKRAFEEFEAGHVEVEIQVDDEGTRWISYRDQPTNL
jgi:tRNA threonylcarbamoyladenosine biosynthesis protein TsaE